MACPLLVLAYASWYRELCWLAGVEYCGQADVWRPESVSRARDILLYHCKSRLYLFILQYSVRWENPSHWHRLTLEFCLSGPSALLWPRSNKCKTLYFIPPNKESHKLWHSCSRHSVIQLHTGNLWSCTWNEEGYKNVLCLLSLYSIRLQGLTWRSPLTVLFLIIW